MKINILLCILVSSLEVGDSADKRRPIWNIAHMANSLYQVESFLDLGANSIEFDVSFDMDGTAMFTFHGFPCDCFRSCTDYEPIIPFLDYLRKLTTPGDEVFRKELVFFMMDLKVSGLSQSALAKAGEDITMKLLDYYWKRGSSPSRAYISVSVPSIQHIEVFSNLRKTFYLQNASRYLSKIGFEFSGNEDIEAIRSSFQSVGIVDHIWQGDGITNCLPRSTRRLLEALARRDDPLEAYMQKVFWWTVDKKSTMRSTLRLGVDAILTNHPDRLRDILKESEFSSDFRSAEFEDNPWQIHLQESSILRKSNLTEKYYADKTEVLYNI